jgi:thaumarchaeosortase
MAETARTFQAVLREQKFYVVILVVILSFAVPFALLFGLDPQSFNSTWKGRTFYLFFVWLIVLELILVEKPKQDGIRWKSLRTMVLVITICLPTAYVVAINFLGAAAGLASLADFFALPLAPIQRPSWIYWSWSLSLEYLVFAMLFAAIIVVGYGKAGLKNFSISFLFIGAVGAVYLMDTLYPYGYFTPFQAFVPFTASMAAAFLNGLGYQTAFVGQSLGTPVLALYDSSGNLITQYGVGWPCAGVQSLLIYTCVMLIFFKRSTIPLLHRGIYFIAGALITYSVNILRIASIYLTYANNLNQGREVAHQAAMLFHDYYGGLYSMTWIVAYPLIVIGASLLWTRIKIRMQGFSSRQDLE